MSVDRSLLRFFTGFPVVRGREKGGVLKGSLFNGWGLTAGIAAALVLLSAVMVQMAPDPVHQARWVIQLTAWTSLLLFGLAFTASSLVRLSPSPATRWLRRQRRYLGVSFAVSHLIHLFGIIALMDLDYALFQQLTNRMTVIAGGGAYLLILAMTLTSFDRMVRLLGPTAWGWLHLIGGWYVWASFAVSMGKRLGQGPLYWLGLGVVLSMLALRLVSRRVATALVR